MTDQEKHDLSERLARLAEAAGLPGTLLWEPEDRCDRRHPPSWYITDHTVDPGGCYCGQCYEEYSHSQGYQAPETEADVEAMRHVLREHPDGWVRRQPKDLTDPTHLLPLSEAWRKQVEALAQALYAAMEEEYG